MSTHDTPAAGLAVTTDVEATPATFTDPGLPPHQPRLGDSDPAAAKVSERIVVGLLTLSILGTVGFVIAYFAFPPGETVSSMRLSNFLLGMGLFLAMASIGFAAVHWAKSIMSDHEHVDERHEQRSSDEDRAAAVAALKDGADDSGIGRRGALKGALVTALALAPLPIALPLLGNVGGDWNVSRFRHSLWDKGVKLTIDPSGRPLRAADLTIGQAVHVIPENLTHDAVEDAGQTYYNEKAKAVVLLIRMDPRDLKDHTDTYEGIVAYSKICTHVGCPVSLYEQQTHHILCPCHQSTFDAADNAKVVFGPAKRALPKLPITVDDEGYLVAKSDFSEPIGPSFWERLK